MLNAQAEVLAHQLFPNGRKRAGYFCIGSVHGDEGDSLKIKLRGVGAGGWADYGVPKGVVGASGDMLTLVQLTIGGGASKDALKEAIRWAKGWLGIDGAFVDKAKLRDMRARARAQQKANEDKAAAEVEKKRTRAVASWHGAQAGAGGPAQRYLENRGIDFGRIGHFPGSIRYLPDHWNAEYAEKRGRDNAKTHAMVSLFNTLEGQPAGTHVTFLAHGPQGWIKDPALDDQKLTRCAHYSGAHISISKGGQQGKLADIKPGTPVYVSEGIEDALSIAMLRPGERILAAGTLGRIGTMRLPPQAGDLIIIGQWDERNPDPNRADAVDGLEDAIAAQQEQAEAHAMLNDGVVRQIRLLMPPKGVKDWNEAVQNSQ